MVPLGLSSWKSEHQLDRQTDGWTDGRTDLVDYGNKSRGERKPVMEDMVRENRGRKKGESRDLKQEGTYYYLGG